MATATPLARDLHLVVGYDGSPPASRALDSAVALMPGRTGRIEVVYVAHLSGTVMLSAAEQQPAADFTSLRPCVGLSGGRQR